jgi:hypothetical protein
MLKETRRNRLIKTRVEGGTTQDPSLACKSLGSFSSRFTWLEIQLAKDSDG